ncbi:MAG: hybrid sensor histidine kinase/response regulator [Alphaproteobacteria bacterium]|nr:MAG: hybrid sensor histidine kinase/response regulator [Alphaproteobacteria bacterium]
MKPRPQTQRAPRPAARPRTTASGRRAPPAKPAEGALPVHAAPPLATPDPTPTVLCPRSLLWGGALAALAGGAASAFLFGAAAALVLVATLATAGFCLWRALDFRNAALQAELAGARRHVELLDDRAWELRESEERYRTLAEAFGDMVMQRDGAGRVVFVSPALAELVGRDPAAMVGRPFEPVIIESRLLGGGGPDTSLARARQLCLATPAGPRWLHWIDLPVRDSGSGPAAIRSVARDITDHKRAEAALDEARRRAESASEAKSRFLATVSHEMRTPLNGILGMSALLADTRLSAEQAAYNDAIHTSGTALLALIEDMLDLTAIEAGRFEVKDEAFDPARLAEEVCELLAGRAHAKGIELGTVAAADVPLTVRADAGRIRQVLVNLIGNAVKFTDKGGVRVGVEVEPAGPGAQARLAFTVSDTGPGFSPADAARLFGEFVQLDTGPTRRHGGAGLGLSISRAVARRLGGDITVDSTPGRGATFRFSLAVATRRPPAARRSAMARRRVLIVSAGSVEAPALARTITEAGGHAECVARLGEAAARLRAAGAAGAPFDTVVIDPAVSPDPARSLRRLARLARHPLHGVVLVRPDQRGRLSGLIEGGFDAYLVRPVRRDSLLRVVGERRAARDQAAPLVRRPLLRPGERLAPHEVLLAEDNDINALLVRTVLERAGQKVTLATTGREAVRAYRTALGEGRPFALVLMDMHMPIMDGAAAIRAIRRLEAKRKARRARILTLTADEQAEARRRARAAGGDGFLTKPLAPAGLVAILRALG